MIRAAWQRGQALGVKLATIFPANASLGRPSIYAAYLLCDGTTGQPRAILDGTVLTWRKTAADSALGARLLARDDVETMLMVGAGAMAPELIRAHLSVRPSLRRVSIWNRSPARAEALARLLEDDAGFAPEVAVAGDLAQAVTQADLVSCATMTVEPVLRGDWLKPGTHVDLVGAFTADMREADDTVLRRGRVFVDSRDTTIGHIGEIEIPLRAGTITEADILGDHYQLCAGTVIGRTGPDDITVFKNGGGGHLDLMTARHALAKAD